MRFGAAVLLNVALKVKGEAKKAPGEFDLLGLELFSCDHAVLREFLSICAYGMPSGEVRLSVVGFVSRVMPLRLGGDEGLLVSR